MRDMKVIESVVILAGSAGTLVAHGCGSTPLDVTAHPVGSAASAAVLTRGALDSKNVRFYTTATVTVNLWVLQ